MRSLGRARWATCALALTICLPAVADHKKSIADCTTFDQTAKNEDTTVFTLANACTIPLDCKIDWEVICAPGSKKRRAVHPSTLKLTLDNGSQQTTEASAAICGDDAWTLGAVEWSCEPSKD